VETVLVKKLTMANCGDCKRTFPCSCNLINGLCISCYSRSHTTNAIVVNHNYSLDNTSPISEFLVNNRTGLTKEEKLKRINDILNNQQ